MEAIFLKPSFQEKIWGGNKLRTDFGLDIPSAKTGEAWVVSAHPNGLSYVTSPKEYAGMSLKDLYEQEQELFGPNHPTPFPLLVKILDATEDLSIQVHPDDSYAKLHEGENELGKTECWYVISADEGAKIVYGHHANSAEEFNQYIEEGQLDKVFRELPVKAGDFFDVPAGTIHAIGGGITILETQQSSDTTYRVYDYERTDDEGKQRELHLRQSLDVTLFPHQDSPFTKQNLQTEVNRMNQLVENDYFKVYKLDVDGQMTANLASDYYLATVIEGEGTLRLNGKEYTIKPADTFILPHGLKALELVGNMNLIMSCSTE
ncbi:mannose-6-phosphate isomerase, class I [Aerococcaceae bacterium WGS1372]